MIAIHSASSLGLSPQSVAAESYAHFAIPPKLLSVKEACELELLLNPVAIAGALTVKHGHIHPKKIAQGYIQAFVSAQGEREITKVVQILPCQVKSTYPVWGFLELREGWQED